MGRLTPNDQALPFRSEDYLGNTIDLSDYKGKKVLLGFFRGTICPFCIARIKKMIKKNEELNAKGIQIVVVVGATKEDIVENSKKNEAPFPIIADPDQKIFKIYGFDTSKNVLIRTFVRPFNMLRVMITHGLRSSAFKELSILPGEFLIDENFEIKIAHYGKFLCDHLPLEEVLEKAKV